MAHWFDFMTHMMPPAGEAVAVVWILSYASHAILRLIAGLTAIFTHDESSRATRALEVLRVVSPGTKVESDDSVPRPGPSLRIRDTGLR
jgi:hypothetical protein